MPSWYKAREHERSPIGLGMTMTATNVSHGLLRCSEETPPVELAVPAEITDTVVRIAP